MMKPITEQERNCWSIEEVAAGGLLVDGRDYYKAFYHAAKEARNFILIAGWQFDSDVALLRGDDEAKGDGEVRFLPFLNSLCRKNPELKIYILAWDYSLLYTFEREASQEELFNREADERIVFRMDGKHPIGASHHQKFVVIDGKVGFVGGQDICSGRWDDREHSVENPDRVNTDRTGYAPFHDTQAYLVGPVAGRLAELFKMRWKSAFGEDLEISSAPHSGVAAGIPPGLSVKARRVAVSRTVPETLFDKGSIEEIRQLYIDAIHSAEHIIYMENQYFTSMDIFEAITRRMKTAGRNRLQIVIILPKGDGSLPALVEKVAHLPNSTGALAEEVAFSIAQSEILKSLKETASKTGHALGIYYIAATSKEGEETPVFIHSKLFLIDDRFLSVGSANTTNRSMGLDTELNVSWEADPEDTELIHSIRSIRTSLLCEHTGFESSDAIAGLSGTENLVEYLDQTTGTEGARLRNHPIVMFLDEIPLLNVLKFKELSLDPSKPYPEMLLNRITEPQNALLFARGIMHLNRLLSTHEGEEAEKERDSKSGGLDLKSILGVATLDL